MKCSVYERKARSFHFDRVQGVSSEDEANPSEPPGEEVLQGADRLLLL